MIILEKDNSQVLKRQIQIPKKMQQQLQALRTMYDKYLDTTEGGKILKQNTDDKIYNNKSNKDKNGQAKTQHSIPVSVAKERLKMQRKKPTNSLEYTLCGGQEMEQLLDKGIKRARAKTSVSQVPKVPKLATPNKVETDEIKPMEVNGGTVTIQVESKDVFITQEQLNRLSQIL